MKKRKRPVSAVEALEAADAGVVLAEEDRVGLQNRRLTLMQQTERAQAEQRLVEMAQESYAAFMQTLREKYELTDEDDIELSSGKVVRREEDTDG